MPVEIEIDAERDRNYCLTISMRQTLNVLLEIDEANDHNFYAGLTSDISEGGVFVATEQPLPVGASVAMSIQLPGDLDPLEVEGVVRWVRDPDICHGGAVAGYGVQFRALTPEVRAVIQAYIAVHDTLFFEAA